MNVSWPGLPLTHASHGCKGADGPVRAVLRFLGFFFTKYNSTLKKSKLFKAPKWPEGFIPLTSNFNNMSSIESMCPLSDNFYWKCLHK